MSRVRRDQPLQASLLDRLIEEDGAGAADGPGPRLAEIKQSVRRDMEMLLNSHRLCARTQTGRDELDRSVVAYGIPDFTGLDLATEEDRDELVATIEATIKHFEPRFMAVEVTRLNNADDLDRTLRLRIEALMHADPAPEPLVLSSQFDPSSSTFSVEGAEDG